MLECEQLQDELAAGADGELVGVQEGAQVGAGHGEGARCSSALSGRAFPAASTWAKTTWTFSSVRPVDEKPGWGSGRTAGAMSARSR